MKEEKYFRYLEAEDFLVGDQYFMLTSLGQVELVSVSEDSRWFNDPHGTKCTSVKVFPLKHVTAEKDKETEAKRQTLKALVKKGNDRWDALQAELQQLKEENKRLSLSEEEIQKFVNKLKTFNRSHDYIQGYENGLHAANNVIISKRISKCK